MGPKTRPVLERDRRRHSFLLGLYGGRGVGLWDGYGIVDDDADNADDRAGVGEMQPLKT